MEKGCFVHIFFGFPEEFFPHSGYMGLQLLLYLSVQWPDLQESEKLDLM